MKRIKSIQTGAHQEVVLLTTLPGGAKREAALHKRFARFRSKGEWFRFTPEIKQFIFRCKRKRKVK